MASKAWSMKCARSRSRDLSESLESAVAALQRALDFAIGSLARDRFALVVGVLALGEPELNFGPSAFEIYFERNDRVALLAHPPPQTIDLAPMHQQFPRASLLVAELAGGRIGADVD